MKKNKTRIIFVIIILLLIVLGIYFYPKSKNKDSQTNENMLVVELNNQEFNLEIAKTIEEKQQGLMFKQSLDYYSGMIFINDKDTELSFWMKNTLIPLDLIFINSKNIIVDIKRDFQPCEIDPCPSYTSKQPARYVIELNSGSSKKIGLEIGQEIELDL